MIAILSIILLCNMMGFSISQEYTTTGELNQGSNSLSDLRIFHQNRNKYTNSINSTFIQFEVEYPDLLKKVESLESNKNHIQAISYNKRALQDQSNSTADSVCSNINDCFNCTMFPSLNASCKWTYKCEQATSTR